MCANTRTGDSVRCTPSAFDDVPAGYFYPVTSNPQSGPTTGVRTRIEPPLPQARGPLSHIVVDLLGQRAPHGGLAPIPGPMADADPFGADLQLALYTSYELHYRGFAGVDPRWEWDPALLQLRARMEDTFLDAVRQETGPITAADDPHAEMETLSIEPTQDTGLSWYLRDDGVWEQMREYFVHRSLYHLKEADPHAWVIPRLVGQAKASFVAVEFDEFGSGRGANLHQELFADLLAAADLDDTYLGYLDVVGAEALAVVNLMSMLGLHRELRGATVGHFAATEITSPPGSRRLVQGLQRLRAPQPCIAFYAEHVEADAVHEQVVRTDVVGALLEQEPALAADVVFGMRAFGAVEDRLATALLECWRAGQSSLLRTLS